MVRIILLFSFVCLLTCCTENISLEKIKVAFMEEYTDTPSDVRCNGIFAYDPSEIEVTEEVFLKKLNIIVKEIKKSSQEMCKDDVDVRIACLLRYSNGEADTLCMGSRWGTVLNGEIVCDHEELFKMMRGLVYPNSERN